MVDLHQCYLVMAELCRAEADLQRPVNTALFKSIVSPQSAYSVDVSEPFTSPWGFNTECYGVDKLIDLMPGRQKQESVEHPILVSQLNMIGRKKMDVLHLRVQADIGVRIQRYNLSGKKCPFLAGYAENFYADE